MIDQGLKERLTGAVVLMVAAVIFVPWLLDGPEQAQPPVEQRDLELPVAASAAMPAKEPPVTSPQVASVQQATKPADQPASTGLTGGDQEAAQQKPAARPATGVPSDPLSAWAVQVGSFTSKDNAERLSESLKSRGYRAFVTRVNEQGKTFYRVRVGPEQERARADALAERLKKDGQKTAVLRHP